MEVRIPWIAFDSIDLYQNSRSMSAVTAMNVFPIEPEDVEPIINENHIQPTQIALLTTKEITENGTKHTIHLDSWKDKCIPLGAVLHEAPSRLSNSEIIKDSLSRLTDDQLKKLIYTDSKRFRDIFQRSIKCGTSGDDMPPGEVDLEAVEIDLCFCWETKNGDQCAQGIYKIIMRNIDVPKPFSV
jgi:hypothetical protein